MVYQLVIFLSQIPLVGGMNIDDTAHLAVCEKSKSVACMYILWIKDALRCCKTENRMQWPTKGLYTKQSTARRSEEVNASTTFNTQHSDMAQNT